MSRISSSQRLHKRSPPGESRTTLPGQNTPALPPNAVHSSASRWLQGSESVPCASSALQSNAFPQQHASSSTAASPSSTAPDLSYSFDSLPSSSSKTVNSVGQMLPRSSWVPDAEAEKCQYSDCSATFPPANTASAAYFFGLTNIISHPFQSRRHHCRACGKIFCSLHSSNTLPLSTELATSTDGLHMQPPPTTPGLASPVGGAFPFSMLHRSSGSGSTTPLDAPAQYSQDAIQKTPQLSLSTVAARVCDDCFTSLQLAANLAGLVTFNTVSSPSLSSSASVGSTFQPRSHSPVQPKFSTCSQASSASSPAQASGAQKLQKPGSAAASDPMQQRNGQATQRKNMQPLAAMHPLDPRHSLLDLAHKEESAGGSNPDGSLAASLGTTPAIGWTWST